jgi:aspartyl-tRNA(Asn)/glutamyl-tRNA(Gln) amidotransferase subunit C
MMQNPIRNKRKITSGKSSGKNRRTADLLPEEPELIFRLFLGRPADRPDFHPVPPAGWPKGTAANPPGRKMEVCMKVTKETIEHVAGLARLNISEAEKEKLTFEMEQIISYVDKLNELDTRDIKPMEHVIPIQNVLREDRVTSSYDREKLLVSAPSQDNGCYKVPKVVE